MSHPRRFRAIALMILCALLLSACGGSDPASESRDDDPAAADASDNDDDDVTEAVVEIFPGKGITGASVGDTREQVVAALGEPSSTSDVRNEFSGGTDERLEYDVPLVRVLVQAFDGGTEVLQVDVTDPTIITATGDISIGSTQAQLLTAFPDATCDAGTLHLCRLGTEKAGEIVTDFFVEDGEVSRIVVGRILD